MGRFWIGVAVLVIFLGLGIGIAVATDQMYTPLSQTLEQAARESLSGNQETATQLSQQAQRLWQSYRHRAAAFTDHAPMDEIDGLFAQLDALSGDAARFSASCYHIASLISAIAEAQSVVWWNLL